jgi:hypothetical protein
MQVDLRAVTTSLVVDTKKDIHEELDLRILGTWIDLWEMKTC